MSTNKVIAHKGYMPWMAKENAAMVKSIEFRKDKEWKGIPISGEVIYNGVRLVMAVPPSDAVKVTK